MRSTEIDAQVVDESGGVLDVLERLPCGGRARLEIGLGDAGLHVDDRDVVTDDVVQLAGDPQPNPIPNATTAP